MFIRFITIMLITFFLICPFTWASCYKIGLLGQFKRPFKGSTSQPFGIEIQRGVSLALDEYRQANANICFRTISYDINNTISNIPDIIKHAIEKENVHLFIGLGNSDEALMAANSLKSKKGILMTPTASLDELSQVGNRLITLYPKNSIIAKRMAFDSYRNGARKVLIIYGQNNKYSSNIAQNFEKDFTNLGGSIVYKISVRTSDVLLDKELINLKNKNYTHIFIPLFETDVAKIVSFLNSHNINKKLIGSDSWGTYSTIINSMTNNISYEVLLPLIYSSDLLNTTNKRFVKEYKKQFKSLPSDLAAFCYDGMFIYFKMAKICGMKKLLSEPETCASRITPINTTTGLITSFNKLNLNRPITTRLLVDKNDNNRK